MKKQIITLITFLGIALVFASCHKDNENNYLMSNQDFVTQASSSNMFEIAAGNLAVSKGSNSNVKAFGNHMITDHGQTSVEMTNLAQQKGWTIPADMLQKDKNNLNILSSLSGSAFDKQFAAIMITSHQETITLFNNASQNNGVPDNDLRSFASNKLPTLQGHLKDAQTLQTQVGQ